MAEKITRTHEERDALLSKVFDSTLQTKDIEITEAGTTEITPDEGYFALKKVNLNVNVQGGGSSQYHEIKPNGWYWKATAAQDSMTAMQRIMGLEAHIVLSAIYESLTKLNINTFGTTYMQIGRMSTINEVTSFSEAPIYIKEATPLLLDGMPPVESIKDFYILQGVPDEATFLQMMESSGWQRITEEEYETARNERLN